MPMEHNFIHINVGGEIYVKLDDIIFSLYKEASLTPYEGAKEFLSGAGMFFETLKKGIIEEHVVSKQVEAQKRTWWGQIAFEKYNKLG